MVTKKLRIRTIANEWRDDYNKLSYDVYHLDYEKKGYDEIIDFLKGKYKMKDKQVDPKATAFEFERRGFLMDVFVRRQVSGKANVLTRVTCHFTNSTEGCYRVTINNLIKNDTQTAIQKKFPELFDNKVVYFVEVMELPILRERKELEPYYDEGGITYTEFNDRTVAIEAARILAKELAATNRNCFCITVIKGIANCRKRYTAETKIRRERDVYTIGTKSIPETLLARRRYRYYPITVDEYIEGDVQDESKHSCLTHRYMYILTVAINDSRQFVMTTNKFDTREKARNAAENAVLDWAESNQEDRWPYEPKFEYEYKFNTPDLIEVYSKSEKKRLTAMITELSLPL